MRRKISYRKFGVNHKNPHMWEVCKVYQDCSSVYCKMVWRSRARCRQTAAYVCGYAGYRACQKRAGRDSGLVLTGSLGNNIEINAQGIDKGIGMIELGHRLGIDRDEIMACGDGDNGS